MCCPYEAEVGTVKQSAFCLEEVCVEAVGSKAPKEKLQDCVRKKRRGLSLQDPARLLTEGQGYSWGGKWEEREGQEWAVSALLCFPLSLVTEAGGTTMTQLLGCHVGLWVGRRQLISLRKCPAGWQPGLEAGPPALPSLLELHLNHRM